jgi:prepilin-type N-terminal cleavage/methylation domain-containing protein
MKKLITNKKAFTLVEILVVIVILGILFVILMSSVEFSTDKARATGVQTNFQEIALACELTAHEKLGFNSFGWDIGDSNGNKVKDYVDAGDTNHNGIKDAGETWTGTIEYIETWTGMYTLKKPGTSKYDSAALLNLQKAFNANIDPKMKMSIHTDGSINPSTHFKDPWGTEYSGLYLSADDGTDGGAFVFFSAGPDGQLGTTATIQNGQVLLDKTNEQTGKDDYVLVAIYTYVNGKGKLSTQMYGL